MIQRTTITYPGCHDKCNTYQEQKRERQALLDQEHRKTDISAADAIEKLQIELQAMRGAANSYKAENAQLRKDFNTAVERLAVVDYELMQVKKERDAAVAVLRGRCFACKHSRPSEKFKGMFVCDFMDALARNGRFPECKHWQWRGVQEG